MNDSTYLCIPNLNLSALNKRKLTCKSGGFYVISAFNLFTLFPQMKKTYAFQQQDFEALLNWLSADRDIAGEKYEQVRKGLIRFFRFKGCGDAEDLADETISRVSLRVGTFDHSKNVKTITYFYGFAANILFEYRRAINKEIAHEDLLFEQEIKTEPDDDSGSKAECLRACLNKLSADDRQLFIEYYGDTTIKKMETRKKIAQRLNCEINTLHVKVFRLRRSLKVCINKCMGKSL